MTRVRTSDAGGSQRPARFLRQFHGGKHRCRIEIAVRLRSIFVDHPQQLIIDGAGFRKPTVHSAYNQTRFVPLVADADHILNQQSHHTSLLQRRQVLLPKAPQGPTRPSVYSAQRSPNSTQSKTLLILTPLSPIPCASNQWEMLPDQSINPSDSSSCRYTGPQWTTARFRQRTPLGGALRPNVPSAKPGARRLRRQQSEPRTLSGPVRQSPESTKA